MPRFEWDPAKARSNLSKHGITFDDAALVWSDPLAVLQFESADYGEQRWRAIGIARGVVLLLVVHTYPHERRDVIRLISARKATRHERRSYEAGDR